MKSLSLHVHKRPTRIQRCFKKIKKKLSGDERQTQNLLTPNPMKLIYN